LLAGVTSALLPRSLLHLLLGAIRCLGLAAYTPSQQKEHRAFGGTAVRCVNMLHGTQKYRIIWVTCSPPHRCLLDSPPFLPTRPFSLKIRRNTGSYFPCPSSPYIALCMVREREGRRCILCKNVTLVCDKQGGQGRCT